MKTASAKQKGRRLQHQVVNTILERWKDLKPDDVRSVPMGVPGEDIWLSPAARAKFNFSVECKNQEKLNIWSAIKQSEERADQGFPIVVFGRNRSKTYVVIELTKFIDLL